jgi:hypothetical protein
MPVGEPDCQVRREGIAKTILEVSDKLIRG